MCLREIDLFTRQSNVRCTYKFCILFYQLKRKWRTTCGQHLIESLTWNHFLLNEFGCLLFLSPLQIYPYHFSPPGVSHPITVIYELTYGETEMKQGVVFTDFLFDIYCLYIGSKILLSVMFKACWHSRNLWFYVFAPSSNLVWMKIKSWILILEK